MASKQDPHAVTCGLPAYTAAVERLLESYRAIPAQSTVRLAKKTSNLFRSRGKRAGPGLDVADLNCVITIDPHTRTADVAGMCTYEKLVSTTLPLGLIPLVVPQLKTITLGGAVTGLGIESTSFRNGLPHESVLDMDILTGDGKIVTASPTHNRELFYGFPNSYGTLGYATRLRIELEPITEFIELRHVRFSDLDTLIGTITEIALAQEYQGEKVEYFDGVVFSSQESYLILGCQSASAGPVSDYTGMDIYYRSIQHETGITRDRLTALDYLWRWDTDWFWCSRAFGAQNPTIRRLWPKKLLRSSFYWKLISWDHRFGIADYIEARKGLPPRERVVQDVEVPLDHTAEFIHWFLKNIPIEPLWLCPLKIRTASENLSDRVWPLYPLESKKFYVNIGFWSSVPQSKDSEVGVTNKLIEQKVTECNGHKSLYSDSYYSQEQFFQLYGGQTYLELKKKYDPQSRLLDLYAKAVQRK
ncbi:MAG: FAD-binding protein [Mycobacteriaceae bacterium]